MPNPVRIRAKVAAIESFGDGVYRVHFTPKTVAPRFKPGQFLHLTVEDYDPAGGFWPESRVFSIASSPCTVLIDIIYSVKGRYTRRMEEQLAVGADVWLKLPYGEFIVENSVLPRQDVVLVAGGTGISPFLPYLEKLVASSVRERTVRLYFGVRASRLILAAELLDACVAAGLLDVQVFVENEDPEGVTARNVRLAGGRLNVQRVAEESFDLQRPVFFLSGPPDMIITFKDGLRSAGIAEEMVKIDEWD
jgi:NAD(P)H-flavin reductase